MEVLDELKEAMDNLLSEVVSFDDGLMSLDDSEIIKMWTDAKKQVAPKITKINELRDFFTKYDFYDLLSCTAEHPIPKKHKKSWMAEIKRMFIVAVGSSGESEFIDIVNDLIKMKFICNMEDDYELCLFDDNNEMDELVSLMCLVYFCPDLLRKGERFGCYWDAAPSSSDSDDD